MANNSKNRSFFLLLAIFFISLQKLFSASSYTITTDQQFKTFQSTNIVVVGSGEEGYLLLSNHFEKINVVFRPSPRHSYSADYSLTTKKVFLFGGTTYYDDCWIFDEEKSQWQKISSSNTPQARYGGCIVNIGENKFLLFGGLGQQGYFGDTYIFSLFPSSGSFQLVETSSHPSARYYHSMCFVPEEKKVYLFGGYNSSGALNDLWCFDLLSSTWSFISTSNSPQARYGHKMVYADKKIYIFGGQKDDINFFNDLWVYDLQTKSFTNITPTTPATKPSARANFGMAKFPELNQILIFGGYEGGSSYSNELWFLNYISTTFAKSDCAYPPSARDKFCFIKLKDKFFLYGGTSGYAAFDDSYFFYYSTYGETTSQEIMISSQNPTKLYYRYFQFSPLPPTDTVKFQIAYSSNGINFSQFLGYDGTTENYFTSTQQYFSTTTFDNNQYIKIKGYFYSYSPPNNPKVEEIVINYNLAPYPPKLIQIGNPIDNILSSTNTTRPEFKWEKPNDPDGDGISSYTLQISTSDNFYPYSEFQSSTTSYSPTTEIPTGVYFWRVSAKDSYGGESDFSSYYKLEIDTTPPAAPYYVLAKPHPIKDKAILITTKITGDDLSTGTFKGSIIVAYSTETITEENFDSQEKYIKTFPPSSSFSPNEEIPIELLNLQDDTTYFIALKFQDEALNISTMSICVSTITNFIPNIKIITPTIGEEISGKTTISWEYNDFNTDETTHTFKIFLVEENIGSTTTIKILTNTTYYLWNSLEVKNSTYTLKIEIKDTRGAISYDEVKNIKIINSNFPPKITNWVKPKQNEILTGNTIIFWELEDLNLADEHFYELFITTNLITKPKVAEFKNTTYYLLDTTKFFNATNYYLILEVKDEGGLTDISTSPVFSIKNENLPPTKPILLSPKHLSFTSPYKVKFVWQASTDPNPNDKVFYDFYLSTSSNINTTIFSQKNLTNTEIEVSYPIIDEEKKYFWQVKAKDIFDTETPSDIFMFLTYPRFKTISDDNKVYAEILYPTEEKVFIYAKKICDKDKRNFHPIISQADKKDKTDRFIKVLPYDVYEINLYDENFNVVEKDLEYKVVFSIDETQFDIPKQTLKIAYLNKENNIWEFTEYKQNIVDSALYGLTDKNSILTYSNKFGIYTVLAKNTALEPVSNIIVYPNPFNPEKEEVTIEYVLTKSVDVEIYILTLSGGLVKKFYFPKGEKGVSYGTPEGERNKFSWDGRNDKGVIVSTGMYLCKLIFGDKVEYKYIGVVKK
jgi:hypothetical protein